MPVSYLHPVRRGPLPPKRRSLSDSERADRGERGPSALFGDGEREVKDNCRGR